MPGCAPRRAVGISVESGARGSCYALPVSTAPKLLDQALALSEDERLALASELIASVDGPPDAGWDEAWQAELIRREQATAARAEAAPEWGAVRARILANINHAGVGRPTS